MRTALVTLRFILRIKVTLTTSHGTYETVELEERELRITASNESQRRLAMSKYREAVERARARDPSRLPSPPPSPTEGELPPTPMTTSSIPGKGSPKGKGVRRPHTSAGPRDSAREVARGASRRAAQSAARDARPRASRGTSSQTSVSSTEEGGSAPDHVQAWEDELERIEARSRWQTAETPGGTLRSLKPRVEPSLPQPLSYGLASNNHLMPPPPLPPPLPAPPESVQAWEEELERIAAQSRRRSVEMLGFNAERRTRPRIDATRRPPPTPTRTHTKI
jgi:hypothetical protein